MLKCKHVYLTSLCLLGLYTAPALSADANLAGMSDTGWYLGAGLGYSSVKTDAPNIPNINYSDDKNRGTGYKLFGGYRFNPYLGVEGSYINFPDGKYQWRYSPVESGNGTVSAHAFTLMATGRLPLGYSFAALGKFGMAVTKIKLDENWSQPGYSEHITGSETTTVPAVGIGLEYAVNKNFAVRAEYETFGKAKIADTKTKTDLLSVSMGYHF